MSTTYPGPEPALVPRRIAAVLASIVVVFVLSGGTDWLLHATGLFPPSGQAMSDALFVVALAYRVVYAVAGGYLAAHLAPDQPMAHALALGVVGFGLSIVGTVATWNAGPEFGPKWYPLILTATAVPCALAGGVFQRNRSRSM